MTLPVSGEQHDRAQAAASWRHATTTCKFGPGCNWCSHGRRYGPSTAEIIVAYFASLREQGVVFIEQSRCERCGGTGKIRWNDVMGHKVHANPVTCSRCNGTGRARMVDVAEVVEALRRGHRIDQPWGQRERVSYDEAADFIEYRFASEDTAKDA